MILMSDRVYELLRIRAVGKEQGWLFPSTRSEFGRLTDLGKQFRLARRKAQPSEELVLYRARHDYGTRVLRTQVHDFVDGVDFCPEKPSHGKRHSE